MTDRRSRAAPKPTGERGGEDPLRHLDDDLEELARDGLLRSPEPTDSSEGLVVLCSNDYLGYASEPLPVAIGAAAGGAGASRLVSGNHSAHEDAERALASWVGAETALLFTSGYAANVGAIAALARPGDLIVSDALNHASIIDGCRLSGARIEIVPHLDARAVETAVSRGGSYRRRWIVTESYFSMDGDSPDLRYLRDISYIHDAVLVVDEAHALGVFGPTGSGVCAEQGVQPDVLVGTLGKALGLQGAFVAGSSRLRSWLWNRARSFVFSTGVSPVSAMAIGARVERAKADDAGRHRISRIAGELRAALSGEPLGGRDDGPIVPWLIGEGATALARAEDLRRLGILARAIRPPTVPAGTSRIRLTATAGLSGLALARATAALRQVAKSGLTSASNS